MGNPVSADRNPIVVMFSPGGQMSTVYWKNAPQTPVGPVHFLIGRNETIAIQDASNPQATNPKLANASDYGNLQDPTSLWFSVGQRTGSLTTAENYWGPAWSPLTLVWTNQSSPTLLPMDVCRRYARSTQTKGGG